MRLNQLYSRQVLPISKTTAWKFVSNPANLSIITPKTMGFTMLSGGDRPMFPGQLLTYSVSPFPLYTTTWVSEITHVIEGDYFVDEHRFGPYRLWHHKHFLETVQGGVEMIDLIDYKLPMGIFGQLAHPLIVKAQLKKIFAYRALKLIELFGPMHDTLPELHFKVI